MKNKKNRFLTSILIIIFVSLPINLIIYFNSRWNTDALESSIMMIVILIGIAIYQHHKEKKEFEKLNIEDQKFKTLSNFFEKHKLLYFNSLLNTRNSILSIKEKYNLDFNIDYIEDFLSKKAKAFERILNIRLQSYDILKVKSELFIDNCVDLSIIDDEIETIMNNSNYETSYEILNQEGENILHFGYTNTNELDFYKETHRIKNMKYYPDYSIETPFDIEKFESLYNSADEIAIKFYNYRVLQNSIYPEYITKDFEINYIKESKILVIDYILPNIEDIPNVKEINRQLKEVFFKEKEIQERYDNVLYQITLRTIYEIFYNDKIGAIESIVFNGRIDYIDKSDGIAKTNCILTVQALKNSFLEMNLAYVDAKACFKKLKGISCTKLSSITPVRPIISINKKDNRFVESYEVMDSLDETINLASMNWQDFEHLVRELFEKEFASNGGEVKITQSSRDGGVDAIAFDPDIIRGGKIVIQAKRYTNVVGVSSVRDLYGTVMNEGATKGILVTTSHYGTDSHDFAKDKPITLIDGNNLLYLLEKHGYKSKIDILEAKMINE